MLDELGAAYLALGYLLTVIKRSRWWPRFLVLLCLGVNWFLASSSRSENLLTLSVWIIVQVLVVCLAI